jgi:hypothetical protein
LQITSHRTAPTPIDIGSPRPLKELLSLPGQIALAGERRNSTAVASISPDEFAKLSQHGAVATSSDNTPASLPDI